MKAYAVTVGTSSVPFKIAADPIGYMCTHTVSVDSVHLEEASALTRWRDLRHRRPRDQIGVQEVDLYRAGEYEGETPWTG